MSENQDILVQVDHLTKYFPVKGMKGPGVQALCRTLGIDPANVMAFGDNYNDTAMLDLVGAPYIMDTAAAPLRARYPNHTPRPEDVLRALLQTL